MNDVATTLQLCFWKFSHKETLHLTSSNFAGNNSKIAFCATLWGTYG